MPLLKERRVGWLVLCQINGAFPSRENTGLEWTFFEAWFWMEKSQVHLFCVLAQSAGGKCGLLADGQTFSAMSALENPPWSSECDTICWLLVVLSEDRFFLFQETEGGESDQCEIRGTRQLRLCSQSLVESENELLPRKVGSGWPSIRCFQGK